MLPHKTSITKISQYHSFEFHSDHMVMWRYFGIGFGKRWNYTQVKLQPGIQIALPFSATSEHSQVNSKSKRPQKSEKKSDKRQKSEKIVSDLYGWTRVRHVRTNASRTSPS